MAALKTVFIQVMTAERITANQGCGVWDKVKCANSLCEAASFTSISVLQKSLLKSIDQFFHNKDWTEEIIKPRVTEKPHI